MFSELPMFTSEPSLSQRIERMIAATPIVDSFARLRCDQLAAPDLAALMTDFVLPELRAVGLPDEDFASTLPVEERVRRVLPYLKRARNTAASWCLFRVFRDLYDFQDPQLTESNYRDLLDKVEHTGRDPQWARTVLQDRGNIRTVVTSRSEGSQPGPADVVLRLDLDALFAPGESVEALGQTLGEVPSSSQKLRQLVFDWLGRALTGSVRVSSVVLPVTTRFATPDAHAMDALLGRLAKREQPSEVDRSALANAVAENVFAWHDENARTLQLRVGAERCSVDGKSLPRAQEGWAAALASTFQQFKKARFDILAGSEPIATDATVLAQQLPNVFVSGYWAHTCVPPVIGRILAQRVQTAPAWKIGGFLSDATTVEWVYGKLQLVRKATAAALARLVEAGFYEEEEIPPILRQILHDTPRELYGLTTE